MVALDEDGKVVGESASARFQVLGKEAARQIPRFERQYAGSSLALGVEYARHVLLDQAEAEMQRFLKANPHFRPARRLLAQIRRARAANLNQNPGP